MSVTEVGAGLAGVLALLASVYFTLYFRALRNEQVIASAIAAMRAERTGSPPPQRALLSKVADTLSAQERAADRIAMVIHDRALSADEILRPEELLKELLDLPEPQLLLTDFFREYGGSPGSEAAFTSLAGKLVQTATAEVFADLAGASQPELEQLLALAAEGTMATVALAGLAVPPAPGGPAYEAPRAADRDPEGMAAMARVMNQSVRRQLRLATLLHGQAEAMLRVQQNELHGLSGLWVRAHRVGRFRRRKTPFGSAELDDLVTAFDAVGELSDTAAGYVATDDPAHAVYVLSGLRMPAPAGLPGRLYHQESLAQVRPLAIFGIWHRLAVSRWAAAALKAPGQRGPLGGEV
jgi:hypothetical protein